MAKNLLEAYSKRIKVAESVYSKSHAGEEMSNVRKITLAKCLQNVNTFLNEAFENSTGTQRSDMGLFKKFCLNLTNVALPNLIANDLVIVSPMSSMSGYITYVEYTAGTNKGQTAQGDVFNDPFRLGKVDPDYTADRVVETFATSQTALAWAPAVQGIFKDADGNVLGDVKVTPTGGGDVVYGTFADAASAKTGTLASMTFKAADGSSTSHSFVAGDKIAYCYDNVVIPQNDLPILNAQMKSIPLIARARRIAVYYSQIAAFQAKTDYGFDLGDQLAEKAVGQLQYEIDTEVVGLLDETAGAALDGTTPEANGLSLIWSKTLPVGVSKAEHYEGFAEVIENARMVVYNRTKRFAPNYMVIASNILPVLTFMKGFSAAPAGQINGPYFAGTLNGLKVYVSPAVKAGRFFIGVNGNDMMSSVAVYAPYMPVVPTQLLQYADGGTSQGWSTLYDLKVLNKELIVAGAMVA